MNACPFCAPDQRVQIASNDSAVAVRDSFPVSKGHTLVIPRKHVASIFDLSSSELDNVWRLVGTVRQMLIEEFHPHAFNIGVNDGAAAGQTVPHGHVHVIPRFGGDVEDPRGGIRWAIPGKADYWSGRE